jgi:ABC-type glycerol-3-phosphate transport system substrate-binding protein
VEAFRAGQAVFALATLADLQPLQAANSPVRDRFGICRVPGSDVAVNPSTRRVASSPERDGNFVPYLGHGGWLAGVDAKAENAEAARELLLVLSSPRVSLEIACEPAWAGGPTRSTHLDSRAGWYNYGLNEAHTVQLINALSSYYQAGLVNPAYALRGVNEAELVRAFAEQVRPAILEGKSPEEALRNAAAAWTAMTPDRDAFLHEYRMALGLK